MTAFERCTKRTTRGLHSSASANLHPHLTPNSTPNYRYYNNAFNDRVKQDSMNLFLGYYRPGSERNPLHLWDLESDYLLHNRILRPDIR